MSLSVVIPTYKSLFCIDETLQSILRQSYQTFEIVICNDSPSDHEDLRIYLEKLGDARIRYYTNEKNLGYPLNLRRAVGLTKNDFVILMGQDDIILSPDHFKEVVEVFEKNPDVGAITRPYFWFNKDINKPIRHIPQIQSRKVNLASSDSDLISLIETLGQLSGLVYRKKLITVPFNEHVFPAHIYPFLSIMKTHSVYFWPDFSIAVRTESSQTRFLSSIYKPSPTKTWVDMYKSLFAEKKFERFRKLGIDHMAQNYVGLAQIKNYGFMKDLLVDIKVMLWSRPKNAISPKFWVFALGSLLIPRFLLRRAVDWYKKHFLSRTIKIEPVPGSQFSGTR